jgi:hypothetical protein
MFTLKIVTYAGHQKANLQKRIQYNSKFFFYYKNLRWENGAPVQNREDVRAQTTLTKVITFTSLQRH